MQKFFVLLIFLILSGVPLKGYFENSKIDKIVLEKAALGDVPIIVKLKNQIKDSFLEEVKSYPIYERRQLLYDELTSIAKTSQLNLVNFLEGQNLLYKRHYIMNAVFVRSASIEIINRLSAMDEVARIFSGSNTGTTAFAPTSDELKSTKLQQNVEPNISYVGADKVWQDFSKGEGIVIASQDTGVDWDHPALIKQYRGFSESASDQTDHDYNWHDAITKGVVGSDGNLCGYSSTEPCDDNNHGTYTLGITLGTDDSNFIGVAPEASWIACRNMDMGVGNPSTYLSCFEFFLAPYKKDDDDMSDGDPYRSPDIITNSWSCPKNEGCHQDELLNALKVMKIAGIFVVVSAGNSGPNCSSIDNTPAWHSDYTFSVGAISHRTGEIGHFSSRGPSGHDNKIVPHIVAPGVYIRSSMPGGGYIDDLYGTSMAVPHVAGAVALIWSANKNLIGQVDLTARILKESATKKSARVSCGEAKNQNPNNTYGSGILNIYDAVKIAMSM